MFLFPAMLGPTKTLIGPSCKSSSRRLLKFLTCSRVIIFPHDTLFGLAVECRKRSGLLRRDCAHSLTFLALSVPRARHRIQGPFQTIVPADVLARWRSYSGAVLR